MSEAIKTGLVYETPNLSSTPGQKAENVNKKTDEITVAVTPAISSLPDFLAIPQLSKLAVDLARGLYSPERILLEYEITQEQLDALNANDFFKQMLLIASQEWHSLKSTNQRLALEAAVAVERMIPVISARVQNPNEPLPGAVQGFTAISKVAGLGEAKEKTAAPGEKFTIQINLGDTSETFTKSRQTIEIQPQPERDGEAPALQLITDQT
jgi:hypothetical protein